MGEIEKMYKNARIEQKYCNKVCEANKYPYQGWCKGCKYLSIKYPLFTAEKQIELIKILSINYVDKPNKTLWIDKDEIANEWFISVHYSDHYGYNNHANNFKEALAGLINKMWQDLTKEEKQQITDILK